MASRAAKYIRIAQIAISVAILIFIASLLISAIGALLTANLQSNLVKADSSSIVLRTQYSINNPGPISISPLTISMTISAPDGTPISSTSSNTISLTAFQTTSGTIYFNLTLLPGSSALIQSMAQKGEQPVVNLRLDASALGLVNAKITLVAGTITGV